MIHLKDFKGFIHISESIRVEKLSPESYEKETVSITPYSGMIKENREAFLKKLIRISKDLKINPLWLLHTIFYESKFDPKKSDRITGSVGLLSFRPEVLKNFIDTETGNNYSAKDLIQLENTDQLDLIFFFYKTWIDRLGIESPMLPGDFAAITFYPAVVNKDWEWEFPKFVMEKNPDLFELFEGKSRITKKDYYDLVDKELNSLDEMDDSDKKVLGTITGAFSDPGLYFSKKPLEFYKDLVLRIEDPVFAQQMKTQLEK